MQTITVPDDFDQILERALDAWMTALASRLEQLEKEVAQMPPRQPGTHRTQTFRIRPTLKQNRDQS